MEYTFKACALITLFYICYVLFLKRETFFQENRWFLLGGFICSILIPLIVIPVYIEASTSITSIPFNTEMATNSIQETSFNYITLIFWIYGIGACFFFAKMITSFASLLILIRKNTSKRVGHYHLIETNNKVSPFSFFNYIVYNPKQFNTEELEHIINHEKVHVNELHSLDIIISELACVLLWFNPFVWLYKKDLQQNLEFIADQNAQHQATCEKSYQHVLLKTTVPSYQVSIANNFYNSLIKKRIIMLHKSKSNTLRQWKYALILPALALFLMSFNTKDVYVENASIPTFNSFEVKNSIGDINVVLISKDFTDEDLKNVKKDFKNKGVTLKFKGIKRNENGEITAIKIDAKSKNSKTNFSVSADQSIRTIKIVFNSDNDTITIGQKDIAKKNSFIISNSMTHDNQDNSRHEDVKITVKDKHGKDHKNSAVYVTKKAKVIHTNQEGRHIGDNISFTLKDKDGKVNNFDLKINDKDAKTGMNIIHEPLIIINGKESSRKDLNALNFDNVETYNVIKGDNAIKAYGNKAKYGVMQIKMKSSGIFILDDDNEEEDTIFIIKEKGKKKGELLEDGEKTWIDKDGDTHIIKTDKMVFISSDSKDNNDQPLIIIDGKESSREDMTALNPDNIETINVFKDDNAIKLHGGKGKHGVIQIKTKK